MQQQIWFLLTHLLFLFLFLFLVLSISPLLFLFLLQWPPEVYAGELPGKPADVYAVGCILYELCMGAASIHVPPTTCFLLPSKRGEALDALYQHCSLPSSSSSNDKDDSNNNNGYPYRRDLGEVIASMVRELPKERASFREIVTRLKQMKEIRN